MLSYLFYLFIFSLVSALDVSSLQPDLRRIIEYATTGKGKGRAFRRVAEFADTFGHRWLGTTNLENAIDSFYSTLQALNFDDVHQEEVQVPNWVRGQESAQLLQPLVGGAIKELPMKSFGMSVGTPQGGITAPVLVVQNWQELWDRQSEVAGKIIVFAYPWRGYSDAFLYRYASHLVVGRLGGLASLIRSPGGFSIVSPHTGGCALPPITLNSPTIPSELHGNYTAPGVPTAGITVEDAEMLLRMAKRGQSIQIRLQMACQKLPDATSRNLIASITGNTHPEQVVIISGHIDSWDVGQGVVDDGGPLFVALEAVNILKDLGLQPARTVRFISFVAEETGGDGSRQYFQRHQAEADNVVMVSELDQGIWNVDGILLAASQEALTTLEAASEILKDINASAVIPRGDAKSSNGLGLDVSEWTKLGVPTFTLAEHPNNCWQLPRGIDGYPEWDGYVPDQHFQGDYFFFHHTDGDTMSVLDSDQMDRAAAVTAFYVYLAASLADPLPRGPFVPQREHPAFQALATSGRPSISPWYLLVAALAGVLAGTLACWWLSKRRKANTSELREEA